MDTNFINFFKLPNEITFMASTFASGASGFLPCFDNIDLHEKNKILKLNRNSTKKLMKT